MTATDEHTLDAYCPKCHASDSIDMSDGVRLCLQCRCEWRPGDITPAHVIALPAVSATPMTDWAAILAGQSIGDVLRTPPVAVDNDDDGGLRNDPDFTDATDWVGAFVELPDGYVLNVIEDDGTEFLRGVSVDGHNVGFERSKVTYLGDEPRNLGMPTHEDVSDEPLPQTILAVAGLCLTVALDAIVDDGDDGVGVINPRTGWLPPPCDQVPEAECGVAYAAALLITVFGLDKEQVQRLAANLITGAEIGTELESK